MNLQEMMIWIQGAIFLDGRQIGCRDSQVRKAM